MKKQCIGLFGTCGRSTWRDKFMKDFDQREINYFNPVVQDWKPEDALHEAIHLTNDSIILFPVTSETYGIGSLSEIGFSIIQSIALNRTRNVVVFIDPNLDEDLMLDKETAKASLTARKLVKVHLEQLDLPNVYIVDSLDLMLTCTLKLSRIENMQLELNQIVGKDDKEQHLENV